MAIHVGRDNFHYLLPDIMRSVSSAAFISVDFEFLGSPSTSGKDSRSLFDTPHEQYVKICSVVKRFPPCQLGLACFYDFETGIGSGSRYSVDVYCITLFKRSCKSDFSVSPATIRFLVQHGFNFNKFVTDGVTYSNRSELAKLEDKISKDVYDLEVFENGLGERVRSLKMRILCEMVDESEIFPDHCTKNASSRRHSVVIHLFREENKGYEFDECLWDRPLNSLEETVVVFALSQEFPDFEFHVNEKRTLLYVGRRPVMYYNVSNEEKSIRRQESLKNLLQEIAGISSVFSRIFERKPPLVAHNCFLDLMYIYNCFHAELPVTYAEWKKEVHALLPIIVDTKILAGALKDFFVSHGITNTSLSTLGNFLNLQPSPVILPIRTSLVINGVDESVSLWKSKLSFFRKQHLTVAGESEDKDGATFRTYSEVFGHLPYGQQSYHNASFDALVTGDVFIKLAHLFVFTKCSHILDKSLPLHKLFFAVRTEVANKVPFPLTNVDCCKLDGSDVTGTRPGIIEVHHRRHLLWLPSDTLQSNLRNLAVKVYHYFSKSIEVTDGELEYIRDYLKRIFGTFQVDVRVGSNRRSLEIATNTPTTYDRVCLFFDNSDDYLINRSTSKGNSAKKAATKFWRSVHSVVILPVFLSLIFLYVNRFKKITISSF